LPALGFQEMLGKREKVGVAHEVPMSI